MGRPAKFANKDLLEAALRLASAGGPQAVTLSAIGDETGATTGSIYHRYSSREHLLAELWMDVVEGFQTAFIAALAEASDVEGAVRVATFMTRWVRSHVAEARVLLLYRRQDFVASEWPPELVARASALEPQMGVALRAFAKRALGRADADAMSRVRFALLDAPLGGIKPYLQSSKPAPLVIDALIEQTVRAVLDPLTSR